MTDDAPATKRDIAELKQSIEGNAQAIGRVDARFDKFEQRMTWELAHAASAITETIGSQIRALDDRYRDVPGRVTRLEERVDRLERAGDE